MSDDENERFKFVNNDDPNENDKMIVNNAKAKLNQFASNLSIMGLEGGLGWRSPQKGSLQNSRNQIEQITSQEKQKDRRIRKLTNINKHLLQQLKQQNDQLTKRVNKQKFRIPKKSLQKPLPKNEETVKQLQGIRRQLQNAYKQIQYYKQTISSLNARRMPTQERSKIDQMASRMKQRNEDIQRIQLEIKTQKSIKQTQSKQLSKVQNQYLMQIIKKQDQQIKISKQKLKQAKRTLTKRQQLEKKQHLYLTELEVLMKKRKHQQSENETDVYATEVGRKIQQVTVDEISQGQWKQLLDKLAIQKKKYEEYGKKLTYHNYIKSKQSKNLQELELKFKQKAKVLEKLKSKLNQVNKLARLIPKPQIMQRVDLKMQKLKDIISRQNTIQLDKINKVKARVQSEDVRQFKKWQLQHAQRQNDNDDSDLKYNSKNQSDNQDSHQIRGQFYSNNHGHGQATDQLK